MIPPTWLTHDLDGLGGQLTGRVEDFIVEEIPAYLPSGEGEHHYVFARKRGLTTEQLKQILANAAGVNPKALGVAGRKDKWAITTQWISLPVAPVAPDDDRIELLEIGRHRNKLKTGHLKGNRFRIRLAGVHPEAEARLPALLERLKGGMPNYFGAQRFGRDNIERALDLLDAPKRRVKDPQFLISALQSAVFNGWLSARISDGRWGVVMEGDILRKRETGGLFTCEDAIADQARLDAGEIDLAGPMPGPKMRPAEGEAAAREAAILATLGLDQPARLDALRRFTDGTRRAARVSVEELSFRREGDDLWVAFALPKGSYATTLLGELSHALTLS
ncbi:tRNA pseudouridine(13) synthase TruD [Myxococcota bacterium]|nr:tRNA pseudouridine(13) synthase TruD [Myxococcota bacterium]MBU1431192.1 tRNA pseudouridine(13) synthase TruD [Myxococcota bacterium]MBU1897877.1 tRNA pseudouridine(13) synthase TruD [Myxococcota bacterium]